MILTGIVIISGVILLIYAVLLFSLGIGWLRGSRENSELSHFKSETFVSVVVAMRNEQDQILQLLEHLTGQDYPAEQFEIILVNDHSQDHTIDVAQRFIESSDHNIRVINNTRHQTGKKAALTRGIDHAKSDLIVTTDADCLIGKLWLKSMAELYEKHRPCLILAPVLIEGAGNSFIERFQALEFIVLLATAAGAANINRPLFCNGANMAFDKQTYSDLEDPFFADTVSGDDTMLLLRMKQLHPKGIRFNRNKHALVETPPVKTLKEFWNQRKRWVSKSKFYHDVDILVTSYIVFGANLVLVVLFAGIAINTIFVLYFSLAFLFKCMVDLFLLLPAAHYYNRNQLMKVYFLSQLLYPFYSTATAIGGKISGFKWKNRHHHVN